MDYRLMAGKSRMIVRRGLSMVVLFLCSGLLRGQERVTTFGIQIKPIIPSKFFDTSRESSSNGEISTDFIPKPGFNFGMVVRRGISKMWSVETGINLVHRNYLVEYKILDTGDGADLDFRLVGYEIPFQALVYVKLGEKLWMNASAGFSLDMYPSDVQSGTSMRRDSIVIDFTQRTYRRRWLQMAVIANYGFEWRTRESGYFYVGASFHRPFDEIAYTNAMVTVDTNPTNLFFPLSGAYLTLDLRYFFHEDPDKVKKKVRSRPD